MPKMGTHMGFEIWQLPYGGWHAYLPSGKVAFRQNSRSSLERQIDRELRARYLQQIHPEPEVYCLLTFGIHQPGNPECEHEWGKREDEPEYAVWECKKCGARAGCDVWD